MAKVGYVIYKRCVKGDRRKVEARSHDASSGGGARDVRLNPLELFEGVVPVVFSETHSTARGGEAHSAPVYWWEEDGMQGPIKVDIWSPTNARRGELRLSRVHKVTPFDENHIPPHKVDPFFFIWKDAERVWARYVTVAEMREPGWPPALVDPILASVAIVPRERNIRGWINLETEKGQHHDAR
jgi:hypothetical protein